MSQSSNPAIQKLMNEVEGLDPTDNSLEAKLNLIAQKVAEEQQKMKQAVSGIAHDIKSDPADAFACEGCQ